MMLLLLVLAVAGLSGWLWPALICLIVVDVLGAACGVPLSASDWLLIGAAGAAVPLAAFGAGVLLNEFTLRRIEGRAFEYITAAAAGLLLFRTGWVVDCVEAGLLAAAGGIEKPLVVFCSVLNAVLFCGAVTALSVMLLQLLIEVPILWLQGALRSKASIELSALRPVLALAALALAADLAAAFYAADLRPGALLAAGFN